ncbi:hypothetical protein TEA_018937 [Camellia sinensis var. sinensis]|uniref:Uncharacterized protein n=1 Tax=Camellia sinensis var. sinensis TaxID=542762 RepID=A0A4S4EHZ3_CAMSN|nr:hypothetical protein TEA_018937 [Camellia sinensis var. sinensis]
MEVSNTRPKNDGPPNLPAILMHYRVGLEGIFTKHFGSKIFNELLERTLNKSAEISSMLESSCVKGTQLFLVLKRAHRNKEKSTTRCEVGFGVAWVELKSFLVGRAEPHMQDGGRTCEEQGKLWFSTHKRQVRLEVRGKSATCAGGRSARASMDAARAGLH